MLTFRMTDYSRKLNQDIAFKGTSVDHDLFLLKAEKKMLESISAVVFLLNGGVQDSFVDATKPIRKWMETDLKRLYERLKTATPEDVNLYNIETAGGLYAAKKRIEDLIGPQEEEEDE